MDVVTELTKSELYH